MSDARGLGPRAVGFLEIGEPGEPEGCHQEIVGEVAS